MGSTLAAIASTVSVTAQTVSSAALTNPGSRGAAILVNVSAVGATPGKINAVRLQAQVAPGAYLTVANFDTLYINAVDGYAFLVYPGAMDVAGWTVAPIQGVCPSTFRVQVVTSDTNSITFSVTVSLQD